MRKRRVFDIDLPDPEPEAPAETPGSGAEASPETRPEAPPAAPAVPAGKAAGGRRGPMASAVRENAESLRARAELEASIRAENDALAHELVRLRRLGLAVEPVPLERVEATKLIRDRQVEASPDVEDLKESLRAIGLSNPIRVEAGEGGRYELIQGWRRLQAFRALLEETGDPVWAEIPAGIVAPGDDLETSYRRMVDENLVRRDLSFAEMADLARAYAADPQTGCEDAEAAVATLFRSASYQKRSYIRAFAELLDRLDKHLAHPRAIPRNLGLALRRRLKAQGGLADLVAALEARPGRSAAQELSILRGFAGRGFEEETGEEGEGPASDPVPDPAPAAPRGGDRTAADRVSLTVALSDGRAARCTASAGRVDLRGPEAPGALDRERLARAVAAFYAALEE